MTENQQLLRNYLLDKLCCELYYLQNRESITQNERIDLYSKAQLMDFDQLKDYCASHDITTKFADNLFSIGEEIYYVRDCVQESPIEDMIIHAKIESVDILDGWVEYGISWKEEWAEGFKYYETLPVNGIYVFKTLEEAQECQKKKVQKALDRLFDQMRFLRKLFKEWKTFLKGK